MIGVATNSEHRETAAEFFQLFKTAWEFYRSGAQYDAVICCGVVPTDIRATLVIIYSPNELTFDHQHQVQVRQQNPEQAVSYRGWLLPTYTGSASIENGCNSAKTKSTLAREVKVDGQSFIRIGYDLFSEVRYLLSRGQPVQFASIPSIEIHITILRDLLVEYQIAFDEIPPTPVGYNFIVCLTHDVDHFAIRNHKFDHTLFGFLYRASLGSLVELVQGRKSMRQVTRNWLAILSLPLIHLRLLPDFWSKLERYLELDRASTFFIIPRKGHAGLAPNGTRHPRRAARYHLSQLRKSIERILSRNGEIAVHGIDAWCDQTEAKKEKEQIQALTRLPEIGVRMHWLFFDSESARKLDEAGFSYDSTFGYNETVGYRAGTTQAYRPFGTKSMLELPLHIMDTALFYRSHLHLSPQQAMTRVDDMVNDLKQFGGMVTINWHDRSIAPERLWDDFYVQLVGKLQAAGAWFCTAGQAAAWFRRRREVTFEIGRKQAIEGSGNSRLPGLRFRSYRSNSGSNRSTSKNDSADSGGAIINEVEQVANVL